MNVDLAPVTATTWPLLEQLFQARGGPGYCWCMAWRQMPDRAGAGPAERKAALMDRVMGGTPVGLILSVDGTPAGWCSIGPQGSFRALRPGPAEPGLWWLSCFFLHRAQRGKGLSAHLLTGALDMARAGGATSVEATPVDPTSPSYRFMGFTTLFLAHGFRETGRVGERRHVMRKELVGGEGFEPPTFSV